MGIILIICHLRQIVQQTVQTDTIIGDIGVRLLGHREGEQSAQTITDGAGLAVGVGHRASGGERRLQVFDPLGFVELAEQVENALHSSWFYR